MLRMSPEYSGDNGAGHIGISTLDSGVPMDLNEDSNIRDLRRVSIVEHNKNPKTVTIIVEGAPHEWPKNTEISHEQVVELEVPDYPQHPEITYAVTYRNGQGNKPEGVLALGATVKVHEGMIFSVSETGQS